MLAKRGAEAPWKRAKVGILERGVAKESGSEVETPPKVETWKGSSLKPKRPQSSVAHSQESPELQRLLADRMSELLLFENICT